MRNQNSPHNSSQSSSASNFQNAAKSNLQTMPLIIIPAAGYGTRVGSPNAKEVMSSPIDGRPLIEYVLNQAQVRAWPVHIITRKEKSDLIDYLNDWSDKVEITIQYIEPSKEWPETILKSEGFWKEKNILVLPDTVFEPVEILDCLNSSLDTNPVCYACFEAHDQIHWGILFKKNNLNYLCEKPKEQIDVVYEPKAWGLIGFNKKYGQIIFDLHLQSTLDHTYKVLPQGIELIRLSNFKDVTR